jgi:hypothetical protein
MNAITPIIKGIALDHFEFGDIIFDMLTLSSRQHYPAELF